MTSKSHMLWSGFVKTKLCQKKVFDGAQKAQTQDVTSGGFVLLSIYQLIEKEIKKKKNTHTYTHISEHKNTHRI